MQISTFDLKGHLAVKSVLEKLKLYGATVYQIPNGYPGSSFLF